MIKYGLVFTVIIVSSCTTTGRYTGDEYYYTEDGIEYSCREPKAYKGGNCKKITEWEDYE